MRIHQRSYGPKIEVFGWLDHEIIDPLGDLEKRKGEKENRFKVITFGWTNA